MSVLYYMTIFNDFLDMFSLFLMSSLHITEKYLPTYPP